MDEEGESIDKNWLFKLMLLSLVGYKFIDEITWIVENYIEIK